MMALTNTVIESIFLDFDIGALSSPFSIFWFVLFCSFDYILLLTDFVLTFNLGLSFTLPLIESLANTIVVRSFLVIKVIIIIIREFLRQLAEIGNLLLHLVPSNTMGVKCLVEVRDDETFRMEFGAAASVLNTLNCC